MGPGVSPRPPVPLYPERPVRTRRDPLDDRNLFGEAHFGGGPAHLVLVGAVDLEASHRTRSVSEGELSFYVPLSHVLPVTLRRRPRRDVTDHA